jgi:hypothetical protein
MDTFIAGIFIVVVTGVLIAIVRVRAQNPKRPVRRLDESDVLGASILGHQVRDTLSDMSDTGAADGGSFDH